MTRLLLGGPAAPTLELVAAEAGVSRGTASRVLSGSPQVSERAKTAVMAAAERLGYVPNLAARALVTKRSESVAFVVAETEERFFADPFFATVLRGAHTTVSQHRRQLIFVVLASKRRIARASRSSPVAATSTGGCSYRCTVPTSYRPSWPRAGSPS